MLRVEEIASQAIATVLGPLGPPHSHTQKNLPKSALQKASKSRMHSRTVEMAYIGLNST
jgi:hypothetical protein